MNLDKIRLSHWDKQDELYNFLSFPRSGGYVLLIITLALLCERSRFSGNVSLGNKRHI
jgi:hypothetical protein